MGLDSYSYSIPADQAGDQTTDLDFNRDCKQQVTYWRKFNALHGWIEKLYLAKGGQDLDFNCSAVRLDEDDLDKLELDAIAKTLEPTPGFFFGDTNSPFSEEGKKEVLSFISRAREEISAGNVVVYDSWW